MMNECERYEWTDGRMNGAEAGWGLPSPPRPSRPPRGAQPSGARAEPQPASEPGLGSDERAEAAQPWEGAAPAPSRSPGPRSLAFRAGRRSPRCRVQGPAAKDARVREPTGGLRLGPQRPVCKGIELKPGRGSPPSTEPRMPLNCSGS
ncbi:Triple Functional Domain Protein [Manis pentadactyla]|nr:Triple Functional Domain Protein [Manis pentadactyla]